MDHLSQIKLVNIGDFSSLVWIYILGNPKFLSFVWMDRERRYLIYSASSLKIRNALHQDKMAASEWRKKCGVRECRACNTAAKGCTDLLWCLQGYWSAQPSPSGNSKIRVEAPDTWLVKKSQPINTCNEYSRWLAGLQTVYKNNRDSEGLLLISCWWFNIQHVKYSRNKTIIKMITRWDIWIPGKKSYSGGRERDSAFRGSNTPHTN